jgi:hypothetical protein
MKKENAMGEAKRRAARKSIDERLAENIKRFQDQRLDLSSIEMQAAVQAVS